MGGRRTVRWVGGWWGGHKGQDCEIHMAGSVARRLAKPETSTTFFGRGLVHRTQGWEGKGACVCGARATREGRARL